jgi:hypothetical protein
MPISSAEAAKRLRALGDQVKALADEIEPGSAVPPAPAPAPSSAPLGATGNWKQIFGDDFTNAQLDLLSGASAVQLTLPVVTRATQRTRAKRRFTC